MVQQLKAKAHGLLRASEKYTKIDMVYATKGGFWIITGDIIMAAGTFALAILFANLLPPEVFGTYKFVLSVMSILLVFSLGGMTNAVTQAVARGFEGSVHQATRLRIATGMLGGVCAAGIAAYYFFAGNTTLSLSFLLVSLFIPFIEAFGLYESYLQGKKLFRLVSITNIIARVVTLVVIGSTLLLSKNLFFLLIAYLASWTLIRFILHKKVLSSIPPNTQVDDGTMSYGKHLSLAAVVGRIASYIDNIILFHVLGPIQVAMYSISFSLVDQIRGTYKALFILGVPKLTQRSVQEIHTLFLKRLIQTTLVGIIVAGTYFLVAPTLFEFLFPQYVDAVRFSQALAIILVLELPSMFLSTILHAHLHNTPKSWLYIRSVPSVIFIGLLIILTPLLGIWGVVISKIAHFALKMILSIQQWFSLVRKNN